MGGGGGPAVPPGRVTNPKMKPARVLVQIKAIRWIIALRGRGGGGWSIFGARKGKNVYNFVEYSTNLLLLQT